MSPRRVLARTYDAWFCVGYIARTIALWIFFTLSPWQFDGGEGDEA